MAPPSIGSDNQSSSSRSAASPPPAATSTAVLGEQQQQHQHYQHQHQHQHQLHQHYHYQQQQHQQHAYGYTYAPALPVGSPASPPVQSSSPPPQAVSPIPAGGFALVNAQVIPGAPPAQAYAYYPAHGHAVAGSPVGSPQLGPHAVAPIPISSLSGSPPANPRDPDGQLSHALHPQPLVGSPTGLGISPPHFTNTLSYYQPQHSAAANDVIDPKNVYIRNLPEDCTDEALYKLASPYGDIESSKSMIHEPTGKCKGYGFVKYRTEEQAERAIEAFNAQGLQSTLAKDSFKNRLKRLQDKSSANVYISNLSPDIDEDALIELIKPYTVVSARIMKDSLTGQHKGAGFARMPDRETALKVIEKLKGMRLENSPGPLLPRIADSEEQKQLKKQVNGEGGRLDDVGAANGMLIRSGAASPLMWSPVLVYSPPGSLTPQHSLQGAATFDPLSSNTTTASTPTLVNSNNSSSNADGSHHRHQPPRQMSPLPHHQPAYSHAHGVYPIPYQGYASPVGFGSPVGYGSPSGYASPGYMSPTGYASPAQIPGSPQMTFSQFPEQPVPPINTNIGGSNTNTNLPGGSTGSSGNADGGELSTRDSVSANGLLTPQQHHHHQQQKQHAGSRSHHTRGSSRSGNHHHNHQPQQRPRQQSRSGASGSVSQRGNRNDGHRRNEHRRSESKNHQASTAASAAAIEQNKHDLAEAMQEKLAI